VREQLVELEKAEEAALQRASQAGSKDEAPVAAPVAAPPSGRPPRKASGRPAAAVTPPTASAAAAVLASPTAGASAAASGSPPAPQSSPETNGAHPKRVRPRADEGAAAASAPAAEPFLPGSATFAAASCPTTPPRPPLPPPPPSPPNSVPTGGPRGGHSSAPEQPGSPTRRAPALPPSVQPADTGRGTSDIMQKGTCRVCLEEGCPVLHLVAPCACTGDARYVHPHCLHAWQQAFDGVKRDVCHGKWRCGRGLPVERPRALSFIRAHTHNIQTQDTHTQIGTCATLFTPRALARWLRFSTWLNPLVPSRSVDRPLSPHTRTHGCGIDTKVQGDLFALLVS
jgi:hypothetical protein